MNINRHNYETFFLLYVDNELSAAERKAVEQFVQENTDLKTELQLLLETTLPAEAVSFHAKDLLYKNEIDQDVLQENLLLLLDNELEPALAEKIAAGIASDDFIKKEWEILQQTKLDANEKIVFENKESLYRHERDRVITMRFWRIAAAACILFAGLFFGIRFLSSNNKPVVDLGSVATKTKSSTENKDNNNAVGSDSKNVVDPSKTNATENIASVNNEEQKKSAEKQKSVNPETVIKSATTKDNNQTASNDQLNKKQQEVSPKIPLENINKEQRNKTIASTVIHKNSEPVENKVQDEIAINNVPVKEKITAPKAPIIDYSVTAIPDSYAKTTALDETAPDNDNKILYMNEKTVARTKLGGLFRKVKRVIERNTNIKTGNGVTIAGFEIAVK